MPGDRLTEVGIIAAAAGYEVLGGPVEIDGRAMYVVRQIEERPYMTPDEFISWWTWQLIEAERERIRRAIETWEGEE